MLARQAHDEHNPAQFIVTTFHPQVACIPPRCCALGRDANYRCLTFTTVHRLLFGYTLHLSAHTHSSLRGLQSKSLLGLADSCGADLNMLLLG